MKGSAAKLDAYIRRFETSGRSAATHSQMQVRPPARGAAHAGSERSSAPGDSSYFDERPFADSSLFIDRTNSAELRPGGGWSDPLRGGTSEATERATHAELEALTCRVRARHQTRIRHYERLLAELLEDRGGGRVRRLLQRGAATTFQSTSSSELLESLLFPSQDDAPSGLSTAREPALTHDSKLDKSLAVIHSHISGLREELEHSFVTI